MLCEYGCGQEATHKFKNGKWCCSEIFNKCSGVRNNMSKSSIGKVHDKYTKNKISKKLKGKNHPNYGKHFSISEETKLKMSIANTGKKHTQIIKNKISLSNIGKGKLTISKIKERYPFFLKIEEINFEEKNIQVRCKNHNCKNSKEQGGWFTPTYNQLYERIRQIERGNGGCYFYCCEECKVECPLFRLRIDPNKSNKKIQSYTSEEYQTWRQEVFNRNGYYCEYCDEKGTHIHHSRPQKLEPGFVLDPDYGIVCCETCHYKYGHKTGTECSTGNLAMKECI